MHSALLFFFLFRPAIKCWWATARTRTDLVSLTRSHASASSGSDNVSTRPLLQERFSLLISLSLSSSSLFLFFLSLLSVLSFLISCCNFWLQINVGISTLSPPPESERDSVFLQRGRERGGGIFRLRKSLQHVKSTLTSSEWSPSWLVPCKNVFLLKKKRNRERASKLVWQIKRISFRLLTKTALFNKN